MLSDRQLADYMDGTMSLEEQRIFEQLAVDDANTIAQLVVQQRIHQALQTFGNAEQLGNRAGYDRRLKQSIMEAACGKESGIASGGSSRAAILMEFHPKIVLASICFILVAILAASLWFLAPHPEATPAAHATTQAVFLPRPVVELPKPKPFIPPNGSNQKKKARPESPQSGSKAKPGE